jgi:predicted O-methyltransferase YrrM
MNKFNLNRARFSRLVWETLLDKVASHERGDLFAAAEKANALRKLAFYNTGSISDASVFCTYAITKYFQPKHVAEVGTFIGRSTLALAYGMQNGRISTCDHSNDFRLLSSDLHSVSVEQFPRTSAEMMFKTLHEKVDMVYLDGRLSGSDLSALIPIIKSDTIFALDDFEGIEKGVANTSALFMQDSLARYRLIYPPENSLLQKYGLHDGCTIALLLPPESIEWTNQ